MYTLCFQALLMVCGSLGATMRKVQIIKLCNDKEGENTRYSGFWGADLLAWRAPSSPHKCLLVGFCSSGNLGAVAGFKAVMQK